uniref:Ig-like domain-containing protein n=1 Tax=Pyxicephalus adspersus TaxID=30357 RepID=A0AAV3ADR7_PYXAD|nr:TPA: hypothetical protein GDO54_009671 [Pyxicephalus adspersus]
MQSPGSITANLEDTVTMSCTPSTDVGRSINWFQQKAGQSPTLIIWRATTLQPGAPDRYSGSVSRTDFTLTIRNLKNEDEGRYYCQQDTSWRFTQ